MNPIDGDRMDVKLASDGARTTIASELHMHKQLIC